MQPAQSRLPGPKQVATPRTKAPPLFGLLPKANRTQSQLGLLVIFPQTWIPSEFRLLSLSHHSPANLPIQSSGPSTDAMR